MTLKSALHDGIFVATLNRPEVRNAVDEAMAAALDDAFRRFERDDEARVMLLLGAGQSFCAGGDVTWLRSWTAETVAAYSVERTGGRGPLGPTRMSLSKPSIAAIEGFAVGGGVELALLCDLRVASFDAFFAFGNRRWDLPLIDGGTVRLARVIGPSRALDMVMTGRRVDAGEALDIGLINRIADPGHAGTVGLELARQIAQWGQTSLRADRAAIWNGNDLAFDAALGMEYAGAVACYDRAREERSNANDRVFRRKGAGFREPFARPRRRNSTKP